MDRAPLFYLFNIPFPNIEYEVENLSISGEDRYSIIVSKFREKTYQNLERYRVRIEIPNTFDFRENPFRPIFQANFQDIYDFSESYKEYLSKFLNVDPVCIKTKNFIVPFYLLNADELIEINSIQYEIESEMHQKMIEESQEIEGEEHFNWERSVMEEMNREAFEFDPDNYWNID
ncbi:hypothetical protein [Algoriphagus sp. Y33]|uniref:hypothetical protein n=1 Tax=Algoriphagus sp. Y33 TaxID=2772483 RepID=UPI00178517D3|nr:hypothetical protein [Algoriphagus sp. Y33]